MSLEVTVVEQGGRARQVRGLGAWLARSAPKSAQGEVTVVLVSDAKMRALNRRFRGKDTVTDVLSFPGEQGPEKGVRHLFRLNAQKKVPYSFFLGDIVIARGLARRQALEFRHPFAIELRILVLHGLLHLLGYDHDVDQGQMARAEARLRRRAGLPTGLIARSS